MSETWTLWSERRPTDTTALYRWRLSKPTIVCKMPLRPEWSDKLYLCGMGYGEPEWWPRGSNWDGYQRTVPDGLEWRPALEGETEKNIFWGGLELEACPHTGRKPVVTCYGDPPYYARWLGLEAWMVKSLGWTDANKMEEAWNRRAAPPAAEGWPAPRPISEAPKNGTPILGGWPRDGRHVVFWDRNTECWTDGMSSSAWTPPTHFWPLPAPPTAVEG